MKNEKAGVSFEDKIMYFIVPLTDVYKDEDKKEGNVLAPLELKEKGLTEGFTAMIYAQWRLYVKITGEEIDVLEFSHIVNHLVVQQLLRDNGVNI